MAKSTKGYKSTVRKNGGLVVTTVDVEMPVDPPAPPQPKPAE